MFAFGYLYVYMCKCICICIVLGEGLLQRGNYGYSYKDISGTWFLPSTFFLK